MWCYTSLMFLPNLSFRDFTFYITHFCKLMIETKVSQKIFQSLRHFSHPMKFLSHPMKFVSHPMKFLSYPMSFFEISMVYWKKWEKRFDLSFSILFSSVSTSVIPNSRNIMDNYQYILNFYFKTTILIKFQIGWVIF